MATKANNGNGWVKVNGGCVPEWFHAKDNPDAYARFERCREIRNAGSYCVESRCWIVFVPSGKKKVQHVSAEFRASIRQIYESLYGTPSISVMDRVQQTVNTAVKAASNVANIIPLPASQSLRGGVPAGAA
jgi:hypothetical protein